MSNNKKLIENGHQPIKEGYQPKDIPPSGSVKGGYQPTTSEGDNPTNTPAPPSKK